MDPILEVRDLRVVYRSPRGYVRAVDNVSMKIMDGEILSVVGESGSGKSTLALSILRILPPNAKIVGDSILYRGRDLVSMNKSELKDYHWRRISMVPQAALNALNPTMKMADHFIETAQAHGIRIENGFSSVLASY